MKTCWLNRGDNPDCILFMAGWGMGPEPFQKMTAGVVDVLMVYDYRVLNEDICATVPESGRLHLLAWSMGVWVAARLLQGIAFHSATAIGGTCRPLDDRYGIPGRLFDDTINNFSPAALTGFYNAMFDNPEQARPFLDTRPDRPPAEMKEELIALRTACRKRPEAEDIFEHHIVTARDRIFPTRNQIRAWGRKNCATVALSHFPFYQWSSWDELLKLIQHD